MRKMNLDALMMRRTLDAACVQEDGGKGSGNFGHKGRPGQRGGSGKGRGPGEGAAHSEGAKPEENKYSGEGITTHKKKTIGTGENTRHVSQMFSSKAELRKYTSFDPKNTLLDNTKFDKLFPKLDPDVKLFLKCCRKACDLGEYDEFSYKDVEKDLCSSIKKNEITPVQAAALYDMVEGNKTNERTVCMFEEISNSTPGYARNIGKYTLGRRGSGDPGHTWAAKGGAIKELPKGSGTFRVSEGDVSKGQHSINRYIKPDGTIDPARQKLHDDAIARVFSGKKDLMPKPGEPPVLYFLGGGSASGKGSFTNGDKDCVGRFGVPSNKDCPTLDADEFKKELPEYSTQVQSDDFAAGFAHEESSSLVKRALEAAFANGTNVTLDGTGDGSVKGVLKKIAQARKDPNRVIEARYCTASMQKALENANKRAQETGRKIDENVIIGIHESVSEIFPQVASEFDHCVLYDNEDYSGTPIAECVRGGKIKVLDKSKYDAFIKKAYYSGNLDKPENAARKEAFEKAVRENHEY